MLRLFCKKEFPLLLILTVYLINPLGYGHYFAFLLIPFLLLKYNWLKGLDSNFFLLVLFSITYVLFLPSSGTFYRGIGLSEKLMYLFFPGMMYLVGRCVQTRSYVPRGQFFYQVAILVLFLYSIVAFLSIFKHIAENGFIYLGRNIPLLNFGSENELSSTLINSLIAVFIPFIGMIVLHVDRKDNRARWLLIILSLVALVCTVRLGSRTALVIFIAAIFFNYLFFISKIKLKYKVIATILILVFIQLLLSVSLFDSDIFSAYWDRMESKDYGSDSAGGRTELWAQGIKNLWEYPMGAAAYIPNLRFSHNFWLDIARVSGVIPMFFMLWFSIKNLYISAKLIFNGTLPIFTRSFILSINIVFWAIMGVEPILEGNFSFLSLYFMFSGMLYVLYKQLK